MNDTFYQLSLNILKALGGDVTIVYPDADAIWDEINKIYNNAGNRFDIVPLEKTITENGEYEYYPDGDVDAFMPVNLTVNIPQKYTDEQVFEIEANAIQQGYDNGYSEGETAGKLIGREEGYTDGFNTGYSDGVTDGGNAQKAKLVDITITENGTYTKDDGYKTVTVEVEAGIPEEELQQMLQEAMDEGYQDGYAEGVDDGREDGITEQKEKLESVTFRENGTYTREDGWNEVNVSVNVPLTVLSSIDLEVKNNGSYEYEPVSVDGWNKINLVVDVPTSGGDSGKPKIYNGFRLTDNSLTYGNVNAFRQIDFSQYDWSGVYDTGYFFAGLSKSISVDDGLVDADFDNFRQHYNGKMLNCSRLFDVPNSSYPSLVEFPNFGNMTNGCINMSYLCYNQKKITNVDNIANWNTSSVLNMSNMFNGCSNILSVPLFDTSNVTDMSYMFSNCVFLDFVPLFDTSNVTNMGYMFYGCSRLRSIPLLDCGKINSGGNMNIFYNSRNTALTNLGGFKDLGKSPNFSKPSYFLSYCSALSKESVLNVLNNLYDRASAGYSVVTLPFNSASLALLSDEEKAIATNKGWTLATS